jgi:ribonuclease BN (tRNA processing enzyme)
MEKPLRGLLRRPLTSSPLLLPTKVRLHELTPKTRLPFAFEMKRLRHSVPCYGYRLELDGRSVAYCTDTGICPNLKKLASCADLFITECAMKPGDSAPNLFHLTPETAARVASEAGAKKLALFHFDPGKYPSFAQRDEAEAAAKKIFPATLAARDDTVISLD